MTDLNAAEDVLDMPPFLQRRPSNGIISVPEAKTEIIMPKPATDDPEVIAAAERIRTRIRRTTADIIDTGNDLLMVKAKLGHGPFTAWIDHEFGMTTRTAQRYMQAAEFAAGKNDIVSHLPPTTVYKLASPSTPEPIKAEVIADLEAGRPVDHRAIEARIKMDRSIERRHQHQLDRARWRRRRQVAKDVAPTIEPAADTADDLIARRRRHLAELDTAWERADSAVRQTFLRRINAECATEWAVDD